MNSNNINIAGLPADLTNNKFILNNYYNVKNVKSFYEVMNTYNDEKKKSFCGLESAIINLTQYNNNFNFFDNVLPSIVYRAQNLELNLISTPPILNGIPIYGGIIPLLDLNSNSELIISRNLGASLLANMFLCTMIPNMNRYMNSISFLKLFQTRHNQEIAKLQMIIHYFYRICNKDLLGDICIRRSYVNSMNNYNWTNSNKPLLPLSFAEKMIGFEQEPHFAHVDFANTYIGGGVLSGGCVQEEIRFAICPELLLSMLVCSRIGDFEAIQICGTEQFSNYIGYGFNLKFGGDYVDQTLRDKYGNILSEVIAIDALDFRNDNSSIYNQLSENNLLRELNKLYAGFMPYNNLQQQRTIATGNWGCGVFLGCVQLKALLQWAVASQCNRKIKYFPYEQNMGPLFESLSIWIVHRKVSVGELLSVLFKLKHDETINEDKIFMKVYRTLKN